ncbi:hypothetical protein GCM10010313_83580 [Streptomyces violarus]|nr:hypothetical protein GCM10010313_83580 [Streptomyces violarus]
MGGDSQFQWDRAGSVLAGVGDQLADHQLGHVPRTSARGHVMVGGAWSRKVTAWFRASATDTPGGANREVNAGDETEPSSRKSSEETRQIGRVFFEPPGTRSNGG